MLLMSTPLYYYEEAKVLLVITHNLCFYGYLQQCFHGEAEVLLMITHNIYFLWRS